MKKIAGCLAVLISLLACRVLLAQVQSRTIGKFPQKVVSKYPVKGEVAAIAVCCNTVFAGTRGGLLALTGEQFQKYAGAQELQEVTSLACLNTNLFIGARDGVYQISMVSQMPSRKLYSADVTVFAPWEDGFLIGTPHGLSFFNVDGERKISEIGNSPITSIAIKDGKAWIGFYGGLAGWGGKTAIFFKNNKGKASLVNGDVRSIAAGEGGGIYIATAKGISQFDGKNQWTGITGKKGGLPYEDTLAIAAQAGIPWVGTKIGAARYDGSEWQYFQGGQYLANDKVNAVAIDSDGGAWLGTPAGISHIEYRMMTLAEKADYFEKATRERHLRYYLVSDSHLAKPGDLSTNMPFTNDNDGLWTAMYIAAECYRYAATKDPKARLFARQSLEALEFLETVTEIPGLMARSIAAPGEPVDEVKGDHPMQWDNYTADGKWRWKSDTSSDEVVGHYYAYAIYYDLVANDKEKAEIRDKVRRITDYIIRNNYYLLDKDGKPTTYGKWNFYSPMIRRLIPGRGLNSLEILSHLKAAYHITGDQKYQDAYLDLAMKKGYAGFTVNQKINIPGFINHSDDELAFLSYYPLLKYETDPNLLKFYRKSIERSWRIERPEKNPLFDFIYGAVSPKGTDFDLDGAIFTLERISLDLVRWDHRNSQRADIKMKSTRGRFKERESIVPLPPDERAVMKWNGNPYELDTGTGWQPTELLDNSGNVAGGMHEEAGTFWLLPYWMARYYGYISE